MLRWIPLLFSLAACDGSLVHITIDEEDTQVVEQGSFIEQFVSWAGFGDFLNMDLTVATELQNQGVKPGDIRTAEMLTLSLESVSGSDLSFLDEMKIFVEGPDLDRKLIAHADAFTGETLVDFEVEPIDLTDYITSTSMSLITEVNGHRPDQRTEVKAHFRIDVGVTPQGVLGAIP